MSIKLLLLLLVALVAFCSAAKRDNCHGSGRCYKGMDKVCKGAYARFTDDYGYAGYVSRTNGHCTAIYRCDGGYPRMTGRELKRMFDQIYGGQGCKGCGSHAFADGKCEVTANYCDNCLDSGDPH